MQEIQFRQPLWKGGEFCGWHYWGFIGEPCKFVAPCYHPDKALKESQVFTGSYDTDATKSLEGYTDTAMIWEGDIVELHIPHETTTPHNSEVLYLPQSSAFFVCAHPAHKFMEVQVRLLSDYVNNGYAKIVGNTVQGLKQ